MPVKLHSNKPIISEARLRRIIREELARDILIREGFVDTIKKPFKKLADKAKEWVIEKSSELAKKVLEALKALSVPDDIKTFFKTLQAQEGGVGAEELVSALPFASQIEDMKKAADVDVVSMLSTTTEAKSFKEARLDYVLAEEKYSQNVKRLSQKLHEIAVISTWYAVSKTVVTTASLLIFALEGAAKLADMLGLKKLAHFLEGLAQKIEHVEEWFIEKVVFPAPVQYAAYLAFAGGKKVVTKSSEKILTYKQFHAPENKEMKEKVVKSLKIALLVVVVSEALLHVGHALADFLQNIKKSVVEIMKAAEHAGLESRGIAKIGSELARGEAAISDITRTRPTN